MSKNNSFLLLFSRLPVQQTVRAAAFTVATLFIFTLSAQSASAAAITVNGLGDAIAADGNCTLREAIQNANADNQSGTPTVRRARARTQSASRLPER